MGIGEVVFNKAKQAVNWIRPDEPAPNLDEKIVNPRREELVAYKFERIDPAIDSAVLRQNPFIFALGVAVRRMLDLSGQIFWEVCLSEARNKQRQHLDQGMQAAADKTNKVEWLLNLGGILSGGLMLGGPKLPALAGEILKKGLSAQRQEWLGKLTIFGIGAGKWIMELTENSGQKRAVKQIELYGQNVAQMPTNYAHISGQIYEAMQNGHQALAQTWQHKSESASGRKQDEKQNMDVLHRIVTDVIDVLKRLAERLTALS
jgi:hypothetical protein